MSGPYDQPSNIPPTDLFDPNYGMYDGPPGGIYAGVSVTPTSLDRVAFWYRPEPQEPTYHNDASLYNPGMQLQGPQMDNSSGVKHRRTRSGCFTCRSRRVKCDETRPICDRCRKGNRECEFPLHSSSSKRQKSTDLKNIGAEVKIRASRDGHKLGTIKDEIEDDEEYLEEDDEDESILDEVSSPRTTSSRPKLERLRTHSGHNIKRKQKQRQRSDASSATRERAVSPSTETSETLSGGQTPASLELTPTTTNTSMHRLRQRWKTLRPDLPPEIEKYLLFQLNHMTYYHYFFKLDPNDFIHNELIDLALQYEPLLYAVVGFAAYHHTVQLPEAEADFNIFWKFYCHSIMSLRKWLKKHTERNEAVLLTVLQLATFEEYLGDWPNLAIHHKAAYSILTTLYTPDTITRTDTSRRIFDWYTRFDVISGIMAVRDATLGREWLATVQTWYEDQARADATESTALLESIVANLRLIGFDIAHLFATANQSQSPQQSSPILQDTDFVDNFLAEARKISTRMDEFRQRVERLNDTHMAATQVLNPPIDEEHLFDPHIPLFRDRLWPLNFVWIDWYAVEQLHKYQTFVFLQKVTQSGLRSPQDSQLEVTFPPELSKLSLLQCQIYEAVEKAAGAPAGALLGCQASLGISTVFLPKAPPDSNNRYMMWARQKLANVEKMGYIWPPHFRQRMAQLWDRKEINEWWLPNGEGKFKLLDEIRTVVEDRNRAAAEQLQRTGKGDDSAGLREIRALFEGLDVDRPDSARIDGHRISVSSASEAGSSNTSNPAASPGGRSLTEAEGSFGKARTQKRSRSSLANVTGLTAPSSTADDAGDRMSGVWEGSLGDQQDS